MNKAELRSAYKLKRQELSDDKIEEASLAIANKLLELPIWDKEFYHVFLPIEKQREVNTEYLLSILNGKDKNVVLSKSDFEQFTMTHFLLTDSLVLKTNSWGIPEPQSGIEIKPQQLDVVFVPLLAFDLNGNRLGYGKGFYDRFLSDCKSDTLKIGLSLFEAETSIPHENTDVKLNYCITPDKTYTF